MELGQGTVRLGVRKGSSPEGGWALGQASQGGGHGTKPT